MIGQLVAGGISFERQLLQHQIEEFAHGCVGQGEGHFRAGIDFAYDLTHLGRYARAIGRLTRHWQRVLPSPIFELSYERLVGDQEGVTRELVEFLGLEWDERCLRFYEAERMALTASVEQVRQPLNANP
ncbi:MAG: sulfotransferase, partial [Gemmatimonadetes bacterium]|nr:sulfotransferase [Gemmatimonadota bacterium]